jgi:hypothetical protein
MEFHLPYFALRKVPLHEDLPRRTYRKCLRHWEDLTLLKTDRIGLGGEDNFRLYEAHTSCVVHGVDEWQWVAYAFKDAQHDSGGVYTHETDYGEFETKKDISSQEVYKDPMANGINADKPIWRPRQYFIKVFDMQMRQFKEEWDALVYMLEVDRSEYVGCFTRPQISNSLASRHSANTSTRHDYIHSHRLRLLEIEEGGLKR